MGASVTATRGVMVVTGASRGIGAAIARLAARTLFDAAARLGPLTAVVNNAGITGNLIGNLVDVPAENVRRVMDVNVTGMIYVCQEAVRRLDSKAGGAGGSIINISSTATKAGSPGTWAHYAASKGAVDVLTTGLAAEVAQQGIRVNAVAPGSTNTGLHAAAGCRTALSGSTRPFRSAGALNLTR